MICVFIFLQNNSVYYEFELFDSKWNHSSYMMNVHFFFAFDCELHIVLIVLFLQERRNLPVDVNMAQFTVIQEKQSSNYDRKPQCYKCVTFFLILILKCL